MKLEDVRRFARRDWAAVADARRRYWAEQYERHGGGPARRASTMLLEHARRMQPDFSSDADRANDLAQHARLSDCLHRAARAFAGR